MIKFYPLYKQSASVYLLPDGISWLVKLLTNSHVEGERNGMVQVYSQNYLSAFILEVSETFDQCRKN